MTLPPVTVSPAALSLEHHLLRVMSDAEPTTLAQAVARVAARFPAFGALGTPTAPSPAALNAWGRLILEGWVRYVERPNGRGHVLTGTGENRLETLWNNQVIRPYLDSLLGSYGPEAARRVAETWIHHAEVITYV
jgi:hypothetical protein